MANVTRRSFLWQTSAGAAAIGALAVAPSALARQPRSNVPVPQLSLITSSEPFVAFVRDATLGELALHIGTREVVVRDPDLVARLLKAAR